jgi:hypothetical protein
MGCDWYEIYIYQIKYRNKENKTCIKDIEYKRVPRYVMCYDSDEEKFDNTFDREFDECLNKPPKLLYQDDNRMKGVSSFKMDEIKYIISHKCEVDFDDIISITRIFDAIER